MTDNNKDPGGTIWATGPHKVYYGGKPTRVFAPQYGVINTYKAMQKEITKNGMIPLGVDHLPQEVLLANPTLAQILEASDIDPYNVGGITKIALEGDEIKILESKISNPAVQKLYNEGKLPSYSLVGYPISNPCTTGQADIIIDDFSQISRVDFVPTGGCAKCKTDTGILTAKLSMEEHTMVEFKNVDKDGKIIDKTKDKNGIALKDENGKLFKVDKDGLVVIENEKPVLAKEEISTPDPAKTDIQRLQDTVEKQTGMIDTLTQTVTGIVEGTIEAKLPEATQKKLEEIDEMKLEAKSAKIETLIDAKIASGYATPAMKDGLLMAALPLDDKGVTSMLDSLKTKLWEPEKELNAGNPDDDNKKKISINELQSARKARGF